MLTKKLPRQRWKRAAPGPGASIRVEQVDAVGRKADDAQLPVHIDDEVAIDPRAGRLALDVAPEHGLHPNGLDHLDDNRVATGAGIGLDVLRRNVKFGRGAGRHRVGEGITVERFRGRVGDEDILAGGALDAAGDEVHARRPDEAGNQAVPGRVADVARHIELLDLRPPCMTAMLSASVSASIWPALHSAPCKARSSGGDQTHQATAVSFEGVQFTGTAWFHGARFAGDALFERAQFMGAATFEEARFMRNARFMGTRFMDDAWFQDGQFKGTASFQGSQFTGTASLKGARFMRDADFS